MKGWLNHKKWVLLQTLNLLNDEHFSVYCSEQHVKVKSKSIVTIIGAYFLLLLKYGYKVMVYECSKIDEWHFSMNHHISHNQKTPYYLRNKF